MAQTTDGYLWLGTATGLFRFDGIRFQAYKPQSGQAFPQRNVVSLFAVPDGGLWVGYWYGGVSFIKNGTVTDYGKPEGLPSRAVLAFARDRQGAIWIAAGKDGLARLEGSRWKKIGADWGFAGRSPCRFRGSRRHTLGGDADHCCISRGGRTPVSDSCTGPPAYRAKLCRSARRHTMDGRRGLRGATCSVARERQREGRGRQSLSDLWQSHSTIKEVFGLPAPAMESVEFRILSVSIHRRSKGRLHGSSTIPRWRRSPNRMV